MKFALLCAAALLAAPVMTASASANDPEKSPTDQVTTEEGQKEDTSETPAKPAAEAKKEKLICRRIKLDMSSRGETKVCQTAAQWREFDKPR